MARQWKAVCGCGAVMLALATAVGGESLATKHFEQQKNSGQTGGASASAVAADAAVTEIAIERSGPRRAYRAVIKLSGAIEYTGVKGVARLGDFAGTVSADRVRELADYAGRIGYFKLKDSYRAPLADRTTVYTAVRAGTAEKIVMHYGNKGPDELKTFEQKIDELLDLAVWVPKGGAEGRP